MAASAYAIAWHVEPAFVRLVPRRALTALARRTLRAESVPSPAGLSIAITDDETVRELNRRFRGLDSSTDVLSFGLEAEDGFVMPPGAERQLGEVVISYPTAERQAKGAGHAVEDELGHLMVHGLLHLLGYDHESTRDARAMRGREEALVGRAAH